MAAHVVVVSFPAQGHINPLLRFAKRLASKGLLVTFASTHDVARRIHASAKPVPIGRGFLRFEFFSDSWDADDADPRRHNFEAFLMQLSAVGPIGFKDLVLRQADEGRPVACIVNNPFVPWALDVAEELRIPSAVLWIQSCAMFAICYHYFHSLAEFPIDDNGSNATVTVPGLPPLEADDLPPFLLESSPYKTLRNVILSQFGNIHKASWVFANSFEELERDTIKHISMLVPIIPIGPLVELDGSGVKGDLWKADDCIKWLDSQETNSVVYVSVGSLVTLGRDEMAEMAYGLKDCGRPFLWVVRRECRELLPEGFAEEVEGRGLVVGWSPQDEVLAHRAVACFTTHCGWNSMLELLAAGVPAVAYPQWGDQSVNAKFLADVYGVAVRLKAPLDRKEFVECIMDATDGAKSAEGIGGKCSGFKAAAARAVAAEGGSSDRNIQDFVDEVMKWAA